MANKLVSVILLFILSCVLAQERIYAIFGNRLNLKCKLDLNPTQNVTWRWQVDVGGSFSYIDIYTCLSNQTGLCTEKDTGKSLSSYYESLHLNVNRSTDASFLSLIPSTDESFKCVSGDVVLKIYAILVIDPGNIKHYCDASVPSMRKSGKHHIQLSCGYTFERALDLSLDGKLTLDGLGQNEFFIQNSSQTIDGSLPLDDNFNNITDAHCDIYFPSIDVTRTCTYPAMVKTQYVVEGNGIIVESKVAINIDWQLFGKDGIEEDIANRSWTRDGGRSLLIRGLSEEDVGKVIVWRTKGADNETTNGTIGFTVISDISGDSKKPDPKDKKPAPPRAQSPFFVLTLLFLTLWLITFVVGGIVLFCREEKCKSSLPEFPSTSGEARSPNSNQSSNVQPNRNVGLGENGTPLVRFTTEATNPDISNTNNSAHTPVLERDDSNDDTLNRQSQGNSHLYFTLEKSPSASFRRASAPRWTHGDASTATLDQDQDILWQGYATVGDSNENATCSHDLGEYAEVGEHLIQGKGPPVQSVRPPVRKKPGREEVKEDDISKLYGKVNK